MNVLINLGIIVKTLIICIALVPLGLFIGDMLFTIVSKNKYLSLLIKLLSYVTSCSRCFSFWLSIILTGDLFISSLVSLLMIGIELIQDKISTRL